MPSKFEQLKEDIEKRKNLEMTSPLESWVEAWLKQFGIYPEFYQREYPIGKYLIDFAFVQNKIALEVDGKQHNFPDQVIRDVNKDVFLQRQGWQVLRIESKNCWNPLRMRWVLDLQNDLELRPNNFTCEFFNVPLYKMQQPEIEYCNACKNTHDQFEK